MTTTNASQSKKAAHATNEGDKTMKTTTKSHATNANHDATNEGATTMKTTKTSHADTTVAAPAATVAVSTIAATPAPPDAPPVTTPTSSPSVATLAYIKKCTSLLDQIDAAFPQGDALTSKQKKRQPKARKGSERFTPQLVALARQFGVNLSLVPLDTISNASTEANALVPLLKRIEALTTRASSRMFSLQSATWSGSSKLYSVLKRLAKDNGDIETGLAPVEQFFNHRHPLVAKNHPRTKKGKAALAEQKAAAETPGVAPTATTAPEAETTPGNAAAATPVSAPAATAVTAPVPTASSTGNVASH